MSPGLVCDVYFLRICDIIPFRAQNHPSRPPKILRLDSNRIVIVRFTSPSLFFLCPLCTLASRVKALFFVVFLVL